MRACFATLLLLGFLVGCRPGGNRSSSTGMGASTNGIEFVEVEVAKRLPSDLDFVRQRPGTFVIGLLSDPPRYTWNSNIGSFPFILALKTYAIHTGERLLLAEDLQELTVGPFALSAETKWGITKSFEEMMLTNGVVFLRTGSNTVRVMPTAGFGIAPAIAPPDLRDTAGSGDTDAQVRLAEWYYEHKPSRPANRVEAIKWAVVAANGNSRDAKHLLGEMELFISAKEQADGKAAATAFLETHPKTEL